MVNLISYGTILIYKIQDKNILSKFSRELIFIMSVRLINLNITFLLFTIVIISIFKSSQLTINFFDNLKLVLLIIVFILTIISLFKININNQLLVQILLLCFLIIYGIFLNFVNVTNYDLQIDKEDIILLLFSFLLTYFLLKINNYKELNNYNHIIFYLFLVLTLIFLTLDGYNFDNYTYGFETVIYQNKIVTPEYSQGLAIIFFLASFISLYLYKEVNIKKNPIMFFWYFAAFIFFLFFAFQAGARGETFFGLLILLCMLLGNIKKNFRVIIFFFLIILIGNINFEDLLVFRRFKAFFDGNFGYRDVLMNLSLNLLYNEPKCLILGCGFNFFQDYNGFDYGMYPHNVILEFIITYGLLISIVIFSLVFIGLKNIIFSKSKILLIDIFVIYFFLIALKSGTLISPISFPIIFYLIVKSKIKFNFKLN
jgi:hypothetical protein